MAEAPVLDDTPDTSALRPGRVLDPARREAILEAALQLVAEVGYDRVTMDAIAARAGASKATIYRRWTHKSELIIDAIQCRHDASGAMPDTGSVREDLRAAVLSFAADIDLDVIAGLVSATRRDPELARLVREQMVATKQASGREWVDRCIARGLLPAEANSAIFHDVAPAMLLMRLLITGEPVDDEFVTHMVDNILLPLLTRDLP